MTEDQNDQPTAEEPVPGSDSETAPTPPVAEAVGPAIPMPPASTAETAGALDTPPAPQQPVTPPLGVPQGVPAPGVPAPGVPAPGVPAPGVPAPGAYAMGALGGNPNLGPAQGYHYGGYYGGPPTDPHAPLWPSAPAPGGSGGKRDHTLRNALIVGGAAFAVLAAGVGIGHAAWSSNSAAPSSNTFQPRIHSGNGSGNGGFPFGGEGNSGSSGNSGNSGNSGSSNSSGPSDANAIANKVDPGLVDVNTTLGYQQEQAAGTGIVLSSNGVVLTNNHVINGATSVSVTDIGNQKTYTASVVGYDRTGDIAVLQLHNASGLQTANLANSSNVSVGEDIVGVGNAGGTGGTPSAAGGTVTALNQSITASDQGDGTSEQLSGLIETNANIQPGDSGGALVNTSGEVVGVDTAASSGTSFQFNGGQSSGNQGFAIPINTALSIARTIEAGNGSSTVHIGTTAFLGVEISSAGSSSNGNGGNGGGFGGLFGGNTGNTGSSTSGATVAGVVTNGPAQEAGIAQGDTITSIGGKSISTPNDLTNDMGIYHPGDKVQVAWTDANGQSHTSNVQLSSGPPQ